MWSFFLFVFGLDKGGDKGDSFKDTVGWIVDIPKYAHGVTPRNYEIDFLWRKDPWNAKAYLVLLCFALLHITDIGFLQSEYLWQPWVN